MYVYIYLSIYLSLSLSLYIYIYIYLIEHNRRFLRTYFFANPFELSY